MVPADPNVGEKGRGGLTDTRSASRANRRGSQCFERSYRTCRAQRKKCKTNEQCH